MANIPIYKLTPTEAVVDDTLIKATPFVTGYTYGGSITPIDTPLTEAVNAFYLASTNGTYTNFGGIVVSTLGFIYYKVGDGYSFQAIVAGGGEGGSDVESGDGMDFITNDPVTLGLPSTIDSTTENAVTETSHTHELGRINVDTIVKDDNAYIEYGALYNAYVINDARNIAASGWHIPTKMEVGTLISYLGGDLVAGDKLREVGTLHWIETGTSTNSSGFTAFGSGTRQETEIDSVFVYVFESLKNDFRMWTSSHFEDGLTFQYYLNIAFNGEIIPDAMSYINDGLCVRLIKDSTTLLHGESGIYTGNDGKVYITICIGTQEWVLTNLAETKYRNGDWIYGYEYGVYTPISAEDWGSTMYEAMCLYEDNEDNEGGKIPLSLLLHPPVTIHPDSASRASIDGNQVLTIEKQTGGQPYQVLTAKDIEAGTAQTYDLIIKCRQDITIESIVVECDSGTLTGCTVTIGATAITFSSGTFSVSTTLTEIAATADNVASAGDRVKISTTTGFTGTPTVLNVQLNYTVN